MLLGVVVPVLFCGRASSPSWFVCSNGNKVSYMSKYCCFIYCMFFLHPHFSSSSSSSFVLCTCSLLSIIQEFFTVSGILPLTQLSSLNSQCVSRLQKRRRRRMPSGCYMTWQDIRYGMPCNIVYQKQVIFPLRGFKRVLFLFFKCVKY